MLLDSLGNPGEDNSCNFEWGSLTEIFLINIFNQLKGATKMLLWVPPHSLFPPPTVTPESDTDKYTHLKHIRCLLLRVKS